jgi:hypothetical protein
LDTEEKGKRMNVIIPALIFGFLLYCVLDVALTSDDRVRNLPKLVWLLLVILVPIIGGIAWLVAGRPEAHGAAPGGDRPVANRGPHPHPSTQPRRAPGGPGASRAGPARPPSAPKGPDDDPEFIKQLERRLRRDDDGPSAA